MEPRARRLLTFDFETTNLDYGSAANPANRVVMVAWRLDGERVRYFYGDIMDARQFWQDLEAATDLCAFNAKFEQKWLIRLGVDIHDWTWHDPMIQSKVLSANLPVRHNLNALCKRHGLPTKDDLVDTLMKAGVCPSEIDRDRLIARCVRDVRTTERLLNLLTVEITRRNQSHLVRTRCNFAPVLAEMEMNKLTLDRQRVYQEYDATLAEWSKVDRALATLTGGINLNSPDQMAHFLYGTLKFPEKRHPKTKRPLRNKPSKQFPDGRPKTDKLTLAWLSKLPNLTDTQREFLSLRAMYGKLDAALTKNLKFFKGICDEYDCRFGGQFNQAVAATDRLTSSGVPVTFEDGSTSGVQLQNMPRDFKRLFCAPSDDYYVVEADAPQLEFRCAALIAQDAQAMKDIADPDFDAHCTSASVMQNVDYPTFLKEYRTGDKLRKAQRQAAKPDTFKPLYGGTKGTPAQEAWYAEFQRRYSGVTERQQDWLTEVEQKGCLKLPWGKTFYWPDIYYNRQGVPFDGKRHKPIAPQVCNYPVQELATAEIVPLSIIYLHRRCRSAKIDVQFVNTIHDSVIAYVRKDHLDAYIRECREAFTTDVYRHLKKHYGIECNVPLGVEIVYGQHWGEGQTVMHDDARRKAA